MIFNIALILFALAGFLLAFYIWKKKQHGHKMVCPLKSDCDAVIHSQYSRFFSIPVEIIGMFYYAIIFTAYTLFLSPQFNANSLVVFLVLASSVSAVLFSLYLTFIQLFRIKQFCFWCLTSAGICIGIFILSILISDFGFLPLLAQYYNLFVILHLFGVALGLGSVIVVDVLFYKFLEDFTISKYEYNIMKTLSQVIWFALAILIISGLCFYMVRSSELNHSPRFLVKMIVVLVITINGALLNLIVAPKMMEIKFDEKYAVKEKGYYIRKLAFALGAISMVSWLAAFFLGIFQGLKIEFLSLLGIYIGITIVAVVSSQILERYFTIKNNNHGR